VALFGDMALLDVLIALTACERRGDQPSNAADMTRLLESRYPSWRRIFPPKPPEVQ